MVNKLDEKWTKAMDEYIARMKKDYADWQNHYYKSMTDLNVKKLKEYESKIRYEIMKNGKYVRVVLDPEDGTAHSFIVLESDPANKSRYKPGDILPAKGNRVDDNTVPRGNIFGQYQISWSGVSSIAYRHTTPNGIQRVR